MAKFIGLAAGILAVCGGAHAAVVTDNSVVGTHGNTFAGLPTTVAGSVLKIDGLLALNGATYGERFDGQTVTRSVSGGFNFDAISGVPSSSLTLRANSTIDDNIGVLSVGGDNALYGDLDGDIGGGSVAVLFDVATDLFGFDLIGADSGGEFTIEFFASDGTVLSTLTQETANAFFGYRTTGSLIAGLIITNTDSDGVAFDNFVFNGAASPVPLPQAAALFLMGGVGLRLAKRRQRKSCRPGALDDI